MRFDKYVGEVHIHMDTKRVDFNAKLAQRALNEQIVKDSDPYIPRQSGALHSHVSFPHGAYGDEIKYYAPYAHYMYEGEVYGPNIPIKDGAGNIIGWRSPPHKYPTGRKLQYHTEGTGDHWFERAKAQNLSEWIKIVQEKANGG